MNDRNLIVLYDNGFTESHYDDDGESLLDKAYIHIETDMVQEVPFMMEGYIKRRFIMLVDEEGKLKGKEENWFATFLSSIFPYDMIVGPAVICKMGEEDYEFLSEEDMDFLRRDLSRR